MLPHPLLAVIIVTIIIATMIYNNALVFTSAILELDWLQEKNNFLIL